MGGSSAAAVTKLANLDDCCVRVGFCLVRAGGSGGRTCPPPPPATQREAGTAADRSLYEVSYGELAVAAIGRTARPECPFGGFTEYGSTVEGADHGGRGRSAPPSASVCRRILR